VPLLVLLKRGGILRTDLKYETSLELTCTNKLRCMETVSELLEILKCLHKICMKRERL